MVLRNITISHLQDLDMGWQVAIQPPFMEG